MCDRIVQDAADEKTSLRAIYADRQVGDTFEFGRYPQGANGEVEPIIWRVLRLDSDSLLVIAEDGLDARPYNEEQIDITWEDCTLRSWLNEEFFYKAFNEQEQSLIKTSHLSNNAGPSTYDRIFLLSADEVEAFFADSGDRVCQPTGYAVEQCADVYHNPYDEYDGNAWWWLRSRGCDSYYAVIVYYVGDLCNYGVRINGGSVRPALRLAI